MKRITSILLILLITLSLFAGCTPKAQQNETVLPYNADNADKTDNADNVDINDIGTQRQAMPLIWQVTDTSGQIMYLFGSIHAADSVLYPLPPTIMNAFESSDYVAVEVDVNAFENDFDAQMAMSLRMMYQDGKLIDDDIGSELHERAKDVFTEHEPLLDLGFPLEMLDLFKPYMWTSLLTSIIVSKSGLSEEYGLDKYFLTEAAARGKSILEIESMDEQLDIILGFSMPLQSLLLESALNIDKSANEISELYNLWKQGNESGIEAVLSSELEDIPEHLAAEYNAALMTKRNLKMAEAAKRYMSEGKNVFYIVGIAHMLGGNGIIALLRQSGYTVELLQ
ncbi:MAG: TraB/GumN family protein [Oscillospiraceae bacterium]|nr:TraB/GumN family protein [Oscillospiraceae bacterium]